MDMQQAASDLQREIGLPASVATILAWASADFRGIKVWIDPAYREPLPGIPSSFRGYSVTVERRPIIVAH